MLQAVLLIEWMTIITYKLIDVQRIQDCTCYPAPAVDAMIVDCCFKTLSVHLVCIHYIVHNSCAHGPSVGRVFSNRNQLVL